MVTITHEQLTAAAADLDPRDFHGFADRVTAIDPVLGECQSLHAQAADGNSPDVAKWPQYAMAEANLLAKAGITTAEHARAWWMQRYAS